MKTKILLIAAMIGSALLGATGVKAENPADAYIKGEFLCANGDTLRYRLLRPENPEPGREYPLVLFMHGAGERGSDNERQLIHGGQLWLNPVNRETYPAYVLLPQCPENRYWAYDSRPESFMPYEMPVQEQPAVAVEEVMELLEEVMDREAVDPDRVYVTGLSMGGMATFDLAVRYPDVFAAAVPICGTVNPERLAAAKDVKFRIYHGDADAVVTVEGSREAYRTLRRLGADVTYIEFPGVGHGSWYPAYTDPGFLAWMFSQNNY